MGWREGWRKSKVRIHSRRGATYTHQVCRRSSSRGRYRIAIQTVAIRFNISAASLRTLESGEYGPLDSLLPIFASLVGHGASASDQDCVALLGSLDAWL